MSSRISQVLFVIGLAALAAVGWFLFVGDTSEAQVGGRPPYVLPVTLGSIERATLAPRAALTGTVVSARHSRVGFEVAGRIEAIDAAEGDEVPQGAVLARLDRRDAEVALTHARAAEQLATRELERWLAGTRSEEKRRLAAELEVRKAEVELARKEVERGRELAASNVISQSELDTKVAARDAADARVSAAQEALAQAEAGARPEEIAVQRAAVEVRRAEVAAAERQLEKSDIRAPFAAAVVRRLAAAGDSVSRDDDVLELIDLSRREIELEIPGSIAPRLGTRPRVHLRLDELPAFALETVLDAVVAAADERSRSFRGIVRLAPDADRERKLKPGMFVRAEVELEPLQDALTVPADAVRVVEGGTVVVKAAPHGATGGGSPAASGLVAEWVSVRVLASHGGRTAVEPLGAALAPGEQVVVIGVDLAFPGAPLLPREAGGDGAKPP